MNKYEIIVVGGGPAGMMAAYFAAQGGKSVALFEKKDSCGRKILLTGKGRCNITNSRKWEDFKLHIHPDSGFYKNSFYHFSNQALVEFLTSAGLEVVEQRGERIFPASEKSSDVRDTLVNKLKECPNIDIITNSEVVNVETRPDGLFMVSVMNDKGLLTCEYYIGNKVIMCTGGLSYPATGSTGDGYRIAKLLKHNVVETTPSLTALKPYIYDFSLVGLTLKNVALNLFVEGNNVQSEQGELTFTNGGIEGALGFRVSRKAVKALVKGSKVEVVIDLKPGMTSVQLKDRVTRETLGKKHIDIKKYLTEFIPRQAIDLFVRMNPDLSISNLPVKLKNWKFAIKGYVGYERCVVTAGGVDLNEVSRKTLESKKIPGLYFAGEVLDLDGDTGGYNLQIAFSTGALAGYSAAKAM